MISSLTAKPFKKPSPSTTNNLEILSNQSSQTKLEASLITNQQENLNFPIRAIKTWPISVSLNLELPSWIVTICSSTIYCYHKSPIYDKSFVLSIIATTYSSSPSHNISTPKCIQFTTQLKKTIKILILKLDNLKSRVYILWEISVWTTFLKY